MERVNLDNILPIILRELTLEKSDIDLCVLGFDEVPEYAEMRINFYRDFNTFEATYILNSRTQLFELFHEDNGNILYQSPRINSENKLKKEIKEAKKILDEYTDYESPKIVKLSEIEREKERQKLKGITIRGKFYARRN